MSFALSAALSLAPLEQGILDLVIRWHTWRPQHSTKALVNGSELDNLVGNEAAMASDVVDGSVATLGNACAAEPEVDEVPAKDIE